MNSAYGLHFEGRFDYVHSRIDDDGKTPSDKTIPMTATRGKFDFLALSSLATKYGVGGTNAVRRSLGFTGYASNTLRLSSTLIGRQSP